MDNYKNLGSAGWYKDGSTTLTFQLGENTPYNSDSYSKQSEELNSVALPQVGRYGDYNVLLKGSNNLLPDEITNMVNKNRLLPKLLEKQTYLLYGRGLHVYQPELIDGRVARKWSLDNKIVEWLHNWQINGLNDSAEDYAIKTIRDFYWFEDMWSKWRMRASRRINGALPVAGLEHIENKRCRLSTTNLDTAAMYDPVDSDYNKVVIGRWDYGYRKDIAVYNRMRPNNVKQNSVSVSYHKAGSPGQIYGMNKFYMGIRPWLIGTNNNPESINAYLENSLSARHHVIIPSEYVQSVVTRLEEYCKVNKKLKEDGKPLIKPLGLEIGTEYHAGLRDAYLKEDLKNLTSVLSGRKNEGKIFTTWSFQTEQGEVQWKIEAIDQKYKEFIQALLDYDKRADTVITSALGVDPSISGVDKDGIISKSGADVYYNYIIYLLGLTIPEQKTTEALNWAVAINFPDLYKQGFRIGYYQDTPQRQEEVAPADRLQNVVNKSNENGEAIEKIRQELQTLKAS